MIHPTTIDRTCSRGFMRTMWRGWMASAATVALLCCFATAAMADEVRLKASASLPVGPVKLGDIATLNGTAAEALGDVVIATMADKPVSVTLASVRETLSGHGDVNWGKLSLRGFMTCELRPEPKAADTTQVSTAHVVVAAASPGDALANPMGDISYESMLTLRDLVTRRLVEHASHDAADLRITFNGRDEKSLSLSILEDRWELEPITTGSLGRVLVTARQWRGEQIVATHRITADVALRVLGVVARGDIVRGQVLTRDDLEVAEVHVTNDRVRPLSQMAQAVGQAAAVRIGKGQVLGEADVTKPLLVRRGERVAVRVVVGGMVIRTTARALENGGMDDVIAVANVDSNERLSVRVVGQNQAVPVETPVVATKENKS